MKDYLGHFRITAAGFIAAECFLCDSFRVNMIEHLREDHKGNPVAERLLKLITESDNGKETAQG